jgi:hypothetical protein
MGSSGGWEGTDEVPKRVVPISAQRVLLCVTGRASTLPIATPYAVWRQRPLAREG